MACRIEALRHAAGIKPRRFLALGGETVLRCYVQDLYDSQQVRPEKLQVWWALRDMIMPDTCPST